MKWLLILFYLGNCKVGPAKHTPSGLYTLPDGFHGLIPNRGGDPWGGELEPRQSDSFTYHRAAWKENKTKQISLQNWWWFQWKLVAILLLKIVVPLKYFWRLVWYMLRCSLSCFWTQRATEPGNNGSQVTGKKERKKTAHFNTLLKSLKLEAGAAEVEDWDSFWSILWAKPQTSPYLHHLFYKAHPHLGLHYGT